MQPLRDLFKIEHFPHVLVGLSEPDDAAVVAINDQQAIVSTVDFFPPVVDDPYSFGAIAAANALSDIYAMGAEALFAINLAAFPTDLDLGILSEILRGGAEKVREAGAVIVGGHTVTDQEPKYGLAVTGIVDPAKLMTKGGAKPGDRLVLTKPLGAGVVTTALKNGKAEAAHVEAAVASMSRLNRDASRLARQFSAHAMTDITGYSLLGHGHEMAHLGAVDFEFHFEALRWLPGSEDYARAGIFPGGMGRNRDYFETWVQFAEPFETFERHLLYNPETSGGLLIAVAPEQADALLHSLIDAGELAALVGEVIPGSGKLHIRR